MSASSHGIATADVIAIRDSIRALVTAIMPDGRIVFGGHPAITPMIAMILQNMGRVPSEYVTLYQSRYFAGQAPSENNLFARIIWVDTANANREASLRIMRQEMIRSAEFAAAIFIGGMEGVEEEFQLFREIHPDVPCHPIASTGAAAKTLFESYCPERKELLTDLLYLSLFRRLLNITLD